MTGERRAVESLLAHGRGGDAVVLAERLARQGAGSRLAVAVPHARALVAQERLGEAADVLTWAVEAGTDPAAARDLALLRWHRLADPAGALDACVLGLAGADSVHADDTDDWRVARYELATLYLRLRPASEVWQALRDVGVDAMPFPDRLMATGFAHGLAGNHLEALRLCHGGLAREPYHPAGLYDFARVLAGRDETEAAATVLSDAVHNGDPRLAMRLRHDPELIDVPTGAPVRRSHALSMRQIRPELGDHTVRLVSTADSRDRASEVSERFASDLGVVLRYAPETGTFELYHRADHSYLTSRHLHTALRRIAPLVSDAHWLIRAGEHPSPYVDECTIAGGRVDLRRTPISDPNDGYRWR